MLATSKMFAILPMKVTALGPGSRSWMSSSAYSTDGCHGSAGLGFNASCTSSAVKPSPIAELELGIAREVGLIGDEPGVGEKKACMELSLLLAPPILPANQE